MLDPVKNFAIGEVSTGYNDSATEITLASGVVSKFPNPSVDGEFNVTWWDSENYPVPSFDPNVEIVRVVGVSGNNWTIERAQEGTSASSKNTGTYSVILTPTKKTIDDINNLFSEVDDIVTDLSTLQTQVDGIESDLSDHEANTSNPHNVTKTQVGLGNADNTSDLNKPISNATQSALDLKINLTEKGSNNGVAELDSNGKVPSSQLPSFVDDVLEYSDFASLPVTGESGVIYITIDDGQVYRWSGTVYAEISPSLALGETSSTAYRGDRGKIAYDHSQIVSGNPHNVNKSEVGLGNVDNTSDVNKPVSNAQQAALDLKQNNISGLTLTTPTPASGDFLLFQDISNASLFVRATIQTILNLVWTLTTNGINALAHLSNTSNPHSTNLDHVTTAQNFTSNRASFGKASSPNGVLDLRVNDSSKALKSDDLKTFSGNAHLFQEYIQSEEFINNASPQYSSEFLISPVALGGNITVEYHVNFRQASTDAVNTYRGVSSFYVTSKGQVVLASEQQITSYEGIDSAMAFSCRVNAKNTGISAYISNNNKTIRVSGYYRVIHQYDT